MEKLGLPELTSEQIEDLCSIAEAAAREYVYSRVPPKKVETLNIAAEVEGTKPVRLTIDVDIVLSESMESFDVEELCHRAIKRAFASAEEYLRGLACHSPT